MNSTTIFVKRSGQFYLATSSCDAQALAPSPVLAAQRAAARHFSVGEERIELLRTNEHVFTASVKKFPNPRGPAKIEGLPLTHTRAPRAVPVLTAALLCAACFAAGYCAAVYSVGMILTVRPTP
jgi:hypothetical protein